MANSNDERLPLNAELIGDSGDPQDFEWEPSDAVLYALACGADSRRDLTYVDLTHGPSTLPLLPLISAFRAGQNAPDFFAGVAIELEQLFLVNGSAVIHRSVDPKGHATVSGECLAVWDKGASAVIDSVMRVETDGDPVITLFYSMFVQGGGGFGGDRGPSRRPPVEFTPDIEISIDVAPNSAAIYQLVGEHNPHSLDPKLAAQLGLPGPISAGEVVKGATALAITTHFADGDHSALREISVGHASPHVIGQPLTLRARQDRDRIDFTVHSGDQPVLTAGRAILH